MGEKLDKEWLYLMLLAKEFGVKKGEVKDYINTHSLQDKEIKFF